MIITTYVYVSMKTRGPASVVHAMQDDKLCRRLYFILSDTGDEWDLDGATAVVRYNKPDGTGGSYDTLPDGSAACEIGTNASSSFTVMLAPQVLTCPGTVILAVALIKGEVEISTFCVKILVEANPARQIRSEDYYNDSRFVKAGGWTGGKMLGTNENGNVVELEMPENVEVAVDEVLAAMPVVTEIDLTNFPNGGFTEVVDGETIEHTSSYDESTGILTIDGVTIKLPVEGAT